MIESMQAFLKDNPFYVVPVAPTIVFETHSSDAAERSALTAKASRVLAKTLKTWQDATDAKTANLATSLMGPLGEALDGKTTFTGLAAQDLPPTLQAELRSMVGNSGQDVERFMANARVISSHLSFSLAFKIGPRPGEQGERISIVEIRLGGR